MTVHRSLFRFASAVPAQQHRLDTEGIRVILTRVVPVLVESRNDPICFVLLLNGKPHTLYPEAL